MQSIRYCDKWQLPPTLIASQPARKKELSQLISSIPVHRTEMTLIVLLGTQTSRLDNFKKEVKSSLISSNRANSKDIS